MLTIDQLLDSVNIAESLDDDLLKKIGSRVVEDFETDDQSRSAWKVRYVNALKLAAQVVEAKSTPWPNAANIKYPLLTTAAIQFSARAYPALISDRNVVKCKVTGNDPDSQKAKRAQRVSQHMSYQILEEMEEWEEDMDRMLVMLPVTGTEFKKTYFDSGLGRNVSEHVLAKDLVVDYWAKSLERAQRKTHVLHMTKNELLERMNRGTFSTCELGLSQLVGDELKGVQDKIQGTSAPNDESAPFEVLEQHRFWDLDGDGYQEPYIVTVLHDTGEVLRIVARFDEDGIEVNEKGKIVAVKPVEYFTKFSFIPSLDGGFYDFGWGLLLGPINETVNTGINQLLDAGTWSNTNAGFLSKGIRVRGGNMSFKPNEFKVVDTTGDDLRKGVFMLPAREPSATTFSLVTKLMEAGDRMASTVDILLGESPGQNQPATTTLAVIEQGLKVFTAVYKRLYRALRNEYRKIYRLNRIYLPTETYYTVIDPDEKSQEGTALQADYTGDPTDIQPAADPNMVSDVQKLKRAEAVKMSLNEGSPADPMKAWKIFYEALGIPASEILPEQMPPPPPDPKMEKIKMEDKHKEMQHQLDADRVRLEEFQSHASKDADSVRQEVEKFRADVEKFRAESERMKIILEQEKKDIERERVQLERERLGLDREIARNNAIIENEKIEVMKQKKDSATT